MVPLVRNGWAHVPPETAPMADNGEENWSVNGPKDEKALRDALPPHVLNTVDENLAESPIRKFKPHMWGGSKALCAKNKREDDAARSAAPAPRVAILDRQYDHRALQNRDELIHALQADDEGIIRNITLVETFRRTTFMDQFAFMNAHDILISPHGAQLTSVPFMPDCGGVLEIFPKAYHLPGYFGSLAKHSGLNAKWIYLGEDAPGEDRRVICRSYRDKVRNVDGLCLPVHKVVEGVKQFIREDLREQSREERADQQLSFLRKCNGVSGKEGGFSSQIARRIAAKLAGTLVEELCLHTKRRTSLPRRPA